MPGRALLNPLKQRCLRASLRMSASASLAASVSRRQDGDDVLPIAEQADDIEMVLGLEVEPLHREVGDAPGTQARDLAQLPQAG